jgi:two-component system phosphate regulon response regulator PhoB
MTSLKGRILYTDDDADTRDLINIILTEQGFEVICTDDAAKAIKLAEDSSFDLYIVDNWMPRVSGLDLTRHLRQFDADTPILFFSGAVWDADKQAAYEAGAQAYLVKPSTPDDLLGAVERLLSLKRETCQWSLTANLASA